ncbi:MAG: universal stress protein [Micromonosporaceae bacterium]|nr:universal stress protein [Micromonosporaceae bacterium]
MTGQPSRRIVIGVQDSTAGLRALRCGVAQARRMGAEVYAVRAYAGGGPGAGYPVAEVRVDLSVRAAELARDVLLRAAGGLPPGLAVHAVGMDGAPGRVLVAFADRDDDLLVVGDAQRAGVCRLRSGSVARYCVRHAVCPVLVVPAPALARVSGHEITREAQRLIDAA